MEGKDLVVVLKRESVLDRVVGYCGGREMEI